MMRRIALTAASALLLIAARPAPPPVLAPYIKDGRFDPGDYGWMRGKFADAPPATKAEWAQVDAWLTACAKAAAEQVKVELRAAGVANPKIRPQPYQDELCGTVMNFWLPDDELKSFAVFQSAKAEAQPVARTFIWATGLAERIAGPRDGTLREQLLGRTVGEQMLRFASSWEEGEAAGAPPLSPLARRIARSLLWAAVTERDHANTAWLKQIVADQGWPTIAKVGERAAEAAWLLAQHADDDPAFQLRVLRLMEPLVARNEVSKGNYAYLYDRVMLKIAGTQRYATQMMCRDGRMVAQPIEDEAMMEERRREVGLGTFAEYRTHFPEKC
jgi:hypothetical protein